MKYFIIAGEPSGDLHAANLIRALRKEDPDAQFQFWGGDKMQEAAGVEPLKHYRELAFMGFLEVVQNLNAILRNIKLCKQQIKDYRPDVVIPVDYPGFNLRIARYAHLEGFRVFYYISPKVWAWKQKRVYQIKKHVERMFSILPFEQEFYKRFGIEVDYVGNPLMDSIVQYKANRGESESTPEKPLIALLPGSRLQELKRILPHMLEILDDFPAYRFAIAATSTIDPAVYKEIIGNRNVELVFNKTYELLDRAEAALVTSGTATLETALLNVPQVVCYKANNTSYQIARRLVNIKYISLVNLTLDKEVVVELIQDDLNADRIRNELQAILKGGSKRESIVRDYAELQKRIGGPGASERAAKLMLKYLKAGK